MDEGDASIACADAARRLDEELVLGREHGSTDDPREAGHAADPDGDRDLLEAGSEDGHDDEREQDPRERELHVYQAHEHAVDPITAHPGDKADEAAEARRDRDGAEPDRKRRASAVDEPQ